MKKTLFVLVAVMVILIAADRICKIYEKKAAQAETIVSISSNPVLTQAQLKDYKNATTFRLLPYTVFGLKPNFRSDTVNINSEGLRGPEIGPKLPGSYRIAVVGGSAVFGGEVPTDDSTFTGLLEKKLNREGRARFDVINAGVPAYVSMQEVILLADRVIGYNPDVIVIFDGFNDVLTSLRRDRRPNYPWWFSEIEKLYYTSISKLFLEKKLKKYRPTKLLLNWIENKKNDKKIITVSMEQVAFYRRNIDLMCHLAKSYGIDVVLVFQPVALYKENLSGSESDMIGRLDPDYKKALRKMCDLEKTAMSEVAKANNVTFVDGTLFFKGISEDIFIDEVHFNQKGHSIVADYLIDFLKPVIKSSTGPAIRDL